jgi:clan AA aspartic protease (TIGR02281 family)
MNSRLASITAFLWCLTIANLALASPPPQSGVPTPDSPPKSSAAADQGPVPLRIIADVMINGRGPFHFMFDTGATQTVISDTTVTRLGLESDLAKLVRVQGVNGHVLAPEIQIDSLTIGSLQFRHIDVPVLAGPLFDGLDGILGAQGFDGMKLSVSVLDRRCIITASPRRADTPAGATALRMMSQLLPMVSATVAGVKVRVIIDTGAATTLGNPTLLAALQKAGLVQELHAAPAVLDVTSVRWAGLNGAIPPLQLGRVAVQPPMVTFGDYQIFSRWGLSKRPALLLGMDSLATLATFSIDYSRLQLQLLPRPAAMLSLALLDRSNSSGASR